VGAGAGQNAPLGRAVLGSLFFATLLTLFVVPAFYSIFNRHLKRDAQIAAVTMPGA
jgi:multidrug efflux pump subunit AcrB